jgi:hypothetical protein
MAARVVVAATAVMMTAGAVVEAVVAVVARSAAATVVRSTGAATCTGAVPAGAGAACGPAGAATASSAARGRRAAPRGRSGSGGRAAGPTRGRAAAPIPCPADAGWRGFAALCASPGTDEQRDYDDPHKQANQRRPGVRTVAHGILSVLGEGSIVRIAREDGEAVPSLVAISLDGQDDPELHLARVETGGWLVPVRGLRLSGGEDEPASRG